MTDGYGRRLDAIESRLAIGQLPIRYAMAVDARDVDAWVSLFVPDVRVGRDGVGRDALRDYISTAAGAQSWQLPPDRDTMGKETVAAILAAHDYAETGGYTQKIDYIDFDAYGQSFTQVVVTLAPDATRTRDLSEVGPMSFRRARGRW